MNACCNEHVWKACEALRGHIAALKEQLDQKYAAPEDPVAEAQRDALRAALIVVLGILTKDGGFRTPRQQIAMRQAHALVEEVGR